MSRSPDVSVFTIPPSAPFLTTFVDALLAGQIVNMPDFETNPLSLGDVTVLVPTRRAARTLEDVFLDRLGGQAAILPKIDLLGAIDEEELLLGADIPADLRLSLDLPEPISALKRHVAMTQLVYGWARHLADHLLPADQAQQIAIPSSPADAAWLAGDLLSLMDQVENEAGDWSLLQNLVPDDYAVYWQITLDFLKIATEFWPVFLSEIKASDSAAYRNAQLRLVAQRYREAPPKGPVVITGATSTAPAAIDLMKAVIGLSNGALVLPGVDMHLDERGWDGIGALDNRHGMVFGHPQSGLKRILDGLSVPRNDVISLGKPSVLSVRDQIVSEALRPSDVTDAWLETRAVLASSDMSGALATMSLLEASNAREEALGIALKLRQVIEADPEATAALVTPDRILARRVATELARWKIAVDDSAGRPLAQTPPGILSRIVLDMVIGQTDPQALLALLRHPLTALGRERREVRESARLIELALLRGPRLAPGLEALKQALHHRRLALSDKTLRVPDQVRDFSDEDWDVAFECVTTLGDIFAPFERLMAEETVGLSEMLVSHRQVLELLAANAEGDSSELYAEEAGEHFQAFLSEMDGSGDVNFDIRPGDYSLLLDAFMSKTPVRSRLPGHPRIHIWGSLEARLQTVDCMILGGLNEGIWPGDAKSDPWLSRPMCHDMTLDPPERRIGLAAHDFMMASGMKEVVYTRALKVDGAPAVPSRWLQRLEAFIGTDQFNPCRTRATHLLQWARLLDKPDMIEPIRRPRPCPPIEVRPNRLSITEVETLIRDPYAIYACHVLRLKPITPIGEEPSAAEKGTIIHEALATFARKWTGPINEEAFDTLIAAGEDAFEAIADFPEVRAFWWPRFERVARWVIDEWETKRVHRLKQRHAEIRGSVTYDIGETPFELYGRADRVDELSDDTLSVIDFKTGLASTPKQVEAMLAPQLPLEALIASKGGFEGLDAKGASEIAYVRLSGGNPVGEEKRANKDKTPDELALEAEERLLKLVAYYRQAGTSYLSRARVEKERTFVGDYDHLARVKEWAIAGEDGE